MHWASNTPGSVPKDQAATSLPDIETQGIDEASMAYRAALAAALSLVPHVGTANDPVIVTIAGYSHRGHVPGETGHENEVITITVAARPEDRPTVVDTVEATPDVVPG